jgi:hypothetical protein
MIWLDVVCGMAAFLFGFFAGVNMALEAVARGKKSCLRSVALRQLKLKQAQELEDFGKGK